MYFFTNICCFCLDERVNLINLNKRNPKNKNIIRKLTFCFNNNFDYQLIPTLICIECYTKLEATYDFKKMCIRNFSNFQNYVEQLQYVNLDCKTKYVFDEVKVLVSDIQSQNLENAAEDESLDSTIGDCAEEGFESLVAENKKTSEGVEVIVIEDSDPQSMEGFEIVFIKDRSEGQLQKDERIKSTDALKAGLAQKDVSRLPQIRFESQTKEAEAKGSREQNSSINLNIDSSDTEPEPNTDNSQSVNLIEYPFNCMKCNRLFTTKSELDKHSLAHYNVKLPCSICGRYFSSKKNLTRHQLAKHSPKSQESKIDPLACSTCGKSFVSLGNLKRHIKMLHTTNTLLHVCSLCGNRYKNKSTLSEHLLKHNHMEPYPCGICGKKYTNRNLYRAHMARNHEECMEPNEKKLMKSCKTCGKIFACQSYLDFHSQTHSNDMQFSCEKCDTKFKYEISLKRHIETMHVENPQRYQCSICGNNYTTNCSLKIHLRTHENQLPFQCTICTKAFVRKDKLKKHVLKIHTKPNIHSSTSVAEEFELEPTLKSEFEEEEMEFETAFIKENYLKLKKEETD